MDICPKNTLNIIAKLEMLGFSNSHFQLIHHWGSVRGKDSSLESHKNYLSRSKSGCRVGANNFEVAVYLENCLEKAEEIGKKPDFFKICRSLKNAEDLGIKSQEGSLEDDPVKLDDELLQQFMKGFYGYGNFKSNLWFVGMEEGGGNSVTEIQKRLDIWNNEVDPNHWTV